MCPVLIASEIWPPEIGGPATYAPAMAKALTQYGFSVTVVTYGADETLTKVSPAVQVSVISKSLPPLERYLAYLAQVRRLAHHGVIFAQGVVRAGGPALVTAKQRGLPLLIKVPGDYVWEQAHRRGITAVPPEYFPDAPVPWKWRLKRNWQAFIATRASGLIVTCQSMKAIVANWGVSESRIHIIPNGIAESSQSGPATKCCSRERIIVTAGRLVPAKAIDTVIRAFHVIAQEDSSAVLHIVGTGPEEGRLRALASSLALQHRVRLLGSLPFKDMQLELASACVFVLNSITEGTSHLLLEAMQTRTPIVASNVGGTPEILKTGETAILFQHNNTSEITNALRRLLRDSEIRRTIIANAFEAAKDFPFARTADATANVIQHLLQQ